LFRLAFSKSLCCYFHHTCYTEAGYLPALSHCWDCKGLFFRTDSVWETDILEGFCSSCNSMSLTLVFDNHSIVRHICQLVPDMHYTLNSCTFWSFMQAALLSYRYSWNYKSYYTMELCTHHICGFIRTFSTLSIFLPCRLCLFSGHLRPLHWCCFFPSLLSSYGN
jgi:hypothetical protein